MSPSTPYAPPVRPYAALPTPPHNLDEAARQIDPGTFADYDLLSLRRDALRDEVASAQAELQASAEAQAPHAAEIADLRERLQDTTPRLAKKYEARLAELLPAHQAFLDDEFTMGALTRDTPEIAALRNELMQADYRMRDLAPQVTAAYRAAAERFPHLVEAEPTEAVPMAASEPEVAAGAYVGRGGTCAGGLRRGGSRAGVRGRASAGRARTRGREPAALGTGARR